MERNIAALMRQDARTVSVLLDASIRLVVEANDIGDEGITLRAIPSGAKGYTYITNLPLTRGDVVVVPTVNGYKIGFVSRVDPDVRLEPGDDMKYAWVVDKIDTAGYITNLKRNAEIEKIVAEGYRTNLRRGFAQQILNGMSEDRKAEVLALTGTPAETPQTPPEQAG